MCGRESHHRQQVLKRLKQLLKKYPLRYGDLVRLAIGRFSSSGDLPEYAEEFFNWVMEYRYAVWYSLRAPHRRTATHAEARSRRRPCAWCG